MAEIAYKPNEKVNPKLAIPLDLNQKNVFDYLMKFGKRISFRTFTNGSTVTIYTVPTGKLLFLLTASICADMKDSEYAKLYIEGGGNVILECLSNIGSLLPASHIVTEQAYSIPLRINAGERLIGDSTLFATHTIVGYEVESSEVY